MRLSPVFISATPDAIQRIRRGVGAITDAALSAATSALMSELTTNGCQQKFVQQVADFQTAWNRASAGPTLTVDGLYGAPSSAALQQALDANADPGMSETVPAGCVAARGSGGGGGVVQIPTQVIPGSAPSQNVPTQVIPGSAPSQNVTVGGSNLMPIALAAVVGAGIIGWAIYAKKHPGRRRAHA